MATTESPTQRSTGTGTIVDLPSTSAVIPTNATSRATTSSGNQNEGVLRDVLAELDRERSERAEMAARVRVLEQELHTQKRKNANQTNTSLSTREFLTLQTERDGYLDIVNALTQDRPALSKQTPQRLPVHVLRLLEIIPWDPRARQHLFGQEMVYEWQVLGADKSWQARLRYFPKVFKTLPIVVPQQGKTVGEAPTSSSPPKQCVLTNLQTTQILNIDKGYPLPEDGGVWVWVGGWRIEKTPGVDKEGWSYSNDEDLNLESSYYDEFRPPQQGAKNLVRRRRKWTRSRVMIDYPQASAMTKEHLKLVAEKSSLDVTVEKLSTQLVETKMKLTTLEAEHLTLKEETTRKITKLEMEAEDKERMLQVLHQQEGLDPAAIASLTKKDQVKELRSVVTAWVSNTVSKRQHTGNGDTVATDIRDGLCDDDEATMTKSTIANTDTAANDVKQQMFESLKGKSSVLFEKIKFKGGEELEKMKRQNRNGGLKSWASSSNEKKSTEETTVTEANGSPTRNLEP